MGGQAAELTGPDFAKGVPAADIGGASGEGKLLGHFEGEAVLVVRHQGALYGVAASCTHYGGPLAEGIVEGGTVRCPWHHARFALATGAPSGPALNPLGCFRVEEEAGKVYVRGKGSKAVAAQDLVRGTEVARRVVIVGGGAAGNALAEALRRDGFHGEVTLLSADTDVPVDRPNLSKDYLAGTAPEEWIPLRSPAYYAEQKIVLRLGAHVTSIERQARAVTLQGGDVIPYDVLVLATGATPIRLPLPGADLPHVHVLRSLKDSRALIAAAEKAKRAVVIGAGFIGLEVAASLRTRGLEVHVVAPEKTPLERVVGAEVGALVRRTHEEKGVLFHLGEKPKAIEAAHVVLESGAKIEADLVVQGVGVRPETGLAETAGLAVERGVLVDAHFRTSDEAIYAVGDLARYPDAWSKEKIRVEHWVVAERQAEAVARTLVGRGKPFTEAPFFWSNHFDLGIAYVGHAERWDALEVKGDLAARDATVLYKSGGKILAVVTVGRDEVSLRAEAAMEAGDEAALVRAVS